MIMFRYKVLGCKIFKICFNNWHLDKLKNSWDDYTCKLNHKKCH